MKFVFAFLILSVAFSTGFAQQRVADFDKQQNQIVETEKKSFRWNKDERVFNTAASGNFDISYYRCEWSIDPAIRFINGKVTSYFTITSATDKIIFDLSDTLNVDSITYNAVPVSFQRTGNDALQIQFPSSLPTGTIDSISIYYNGTPRLTTSFKAFSQSTHNGVPVIWTLSEPFGAKEWWPCKNGLTDKADSVDIIIKNPDIYRASANGLMWNETVNSGIRTSLWKHRYPIASYLVAMSVTNFIVQKDSVLINGKPMDLVNYFYPEDAADFNQGIPTAKNALRLFSTLFGDYPFVKEKYGFTQMMTAGGMEHQTNTFMYNPTDPLFEHETGHQWFGDKITCGSWKDIWLNEGFATYCQVLFNEYIDTTNYFPILRNITRDITVIPDGSVYVSDSTNPARIFNTKLSYYKGAYLLHMLRWKLGDVVFFKAINRYLNDPQLQYKYARTADLQRNLEQESGKDLSVFFSKWFYGEGFPSYNCTWTQNKNNWIAVQVNQTTSHASVAFYDMPVELRFRNSNRDTLITVDNRENGETFWVNPGFAADTMFVDPNYHLLAKDRITRKLPAKSVIENDLKIYPVPATDKLHISLQNPSGARINYTLYSSTGQLIYTSQKDLTGRDELLLMPVAKFAAGLYIITISDNKNLHQTRKIIIR